MMALTNKQKYLIAGALVLIIQIIISFVKQLKDLDIKNYLDTVVLAVTLMGIFDNSKKEKKKRPRLVKPIPKKSVKIYDLRVSFTSGVYGGVIGGILSGTVIAIICYSDSDHPPLKECLKIIPYCALIGCLFGGLIHIGRKLLLDSGVLSRPLANFAGSFVACLFAGALSGMLGMWLFGTNDFPFIGYSRIVLASIIGALGLIIGSLVYDYEGKLKYILFSIFVALLLSSFISMVGFLLFNNDAIGSYLDKKIYSDEVGDLIEGGLVLGSINGLVFGLVIGFTIIFYDYRKFSERQHNREMTSEKYELNSKTDTT